MQALAREMNLSETTFVLPAESGGTARVRIFTPRAELPFAGHPTLGTALVLGGSLERETLTLELAVGHVPVVLEREGGRVAGGRFARPAPLSVAFAHADAVLSALGVQRTASPVVVYDNGVRHAVVHLATRAEVDELHGPTRWAMQHRLGRLEPGTVSLAVVVATPHRAAAFAACELAVEECKRRLPVWKLEVTDAGSGFVAGSSTAAPTL